MLNIDTTQTYKDTATGREWTYEDGMWKRAEHPWVQALRRRGGLCVEADGQVYEIRLMAFRDGPDTEIFGLRLSDIDTLLNADKEI